jgi:hypothetical protein
VVLKFPLDGKAMGSAKILIYRYLDDDEEDEETDLTGRLKIPGRGHIIYRKDKTWKVTGVYAAPPTDAIPRFRVHLLDMSKPEFVN